MGAFQEHWGENGTRFCHNTQNSTELGSLSKMHGEHLSQYSHIHAKITFKHRYG